MSYVFGGHDAGGSSIHAASAISKVAGILAAYPKAVTSGKELKSVKGVSKGSMDKVKRVVFNLAETNRRSMHLLGMQRLLCCLFNCACLLERVQPVLLSNTSKLPVHCSWSLGA